MLGLVIYSGAPETECWTRHLCSESDHTLLPAPVFKLCSSLRGLKITEGQRELVGFLPDKSYHRYMYIATKAS